MLVNGDLVSSTTTTVRCDLTVLLGQSTALEKVQVLVVLPIVGVYDIP